jgi:hypothetical protein
VQFTELESVDFSAPGAGPHDALAGWDGPEDGRRWARGWRTTITLPRPETGGGLALMLTVEPYLFPPLVTRQTLRIRVNGTTLRLTHIAYRTTLVCRIPPELLDGKTGIVCDFEHPDIVRPDMVSDSADTRNLSVGFIRLALMAAVPLAELPPPRAPEPAILPPVTELGNAALFGHFASIGNNCEFGLTQRRFGADPMDMLRFTGISFDGLLHGLETGFKDIDDCDEVEFHIRGFDTVREYVISIQRYNLESHTGIFEGDMPPARLISRELKKLRLLRRLFLADLTAGDRIFVFKLNEMTAASDLTPLWERLRRRGPATLLAVVLADPQHPPGTVERVRDGLLRGYIDRLNPYDNAAAPSSDVWAEICRKAYSLWRAGRLVRPEPRRLSA